MKIVSIGGGTGLSVLLRGLKKITKDITAVVSVADDGGGSGVLREDLGMLPPGDIRNCILSLANTEPLMESLIQYRFKGGRLDGQSFGNLLIAALQGISGSFEKAIAHISDIVAITGRVLPVTSQEMTLIAKLKSGQIVEGESSIPKEVLKNNDKIDKLYIKESDVWALDEVIQAIYDADIVLVGPGSLYTSIIPNLLVDGIVDAMVKSSAIKIYVANLMTQPGETGGYSFAEHIDELFTYSSEKIFDCIIANNQIMDENILSRYKNKFSEPIYMTQDDENRFIDLGIEVYKGDFVEIAYAHIRHDCDKISQLLVDIWEDKAIDKEYSSMGE